MIHDSHHHITTRRFQRYYFRAIVGIATPIIVTGAYVTIWAVYLRSLDEKSNFIAGPPGGSYVFYAWFIIGVLGLPLSVYGMNAVESGILMSAAAGRTVPAALVAYDKYAAGTWSGPSGWIKMLRRFRRRRRNGGPNAGEAAPGLSWRLWFCLALPNVLLFVALPISGLSLEMETGFVRRTARNSTGPGVTGFTYDNFNERVTSEAIRGANSMWKNAMDARVPGLGVIYTRPDAEEPMPPGALPKDDGVSGIFLTAQAQNPIDGTAWGLSLEYNCSIVDGLSDLTVLKKESERVNYTSSMYRFGMTPIFAGPKGQSIRRVYIANETRNVGNLYGVAEFGYKEWPDSDMTDQLLSEDSIWPLPTECYLQQNMTGDYHDIDQESVFEIVLWQHMRTPGYFNPVPNYNESLSHNLTELYGEYYIVIEESLGRGDYIHIQREQVQNDDSASAMSAIGARCSSSASVGTARIDGVKSTFTDFVRTDTPIGSSANQRCGRRFNAKSIFESLSISLVINSYEVAGPWLGVLFSSVSGEPELYAKMDANTTLELETAPVVRLSYLQASQLRASMLRAYAAYAINLMYSNGQGFLTFDGGDGMGLGNPNVTAFPSGTVIKPGPVPMEVVMVMFFIWTLATAVLCGMYGFRRRWSDTVDEGIRSFTR